jgi:hypothetical protein
MREKKIIKEQNRKARESEKKIIFEKENKITFNWECWRMGEQENG